MARMLGKYETPGCCPGTNRGSYRLRRRYQRPSDCSGASSSTRWRKRVEQRQFGRELARELCPVEFYWHPDELAFDIYDCDHGCNGDCESSEYGSDRCTFICHEMLRVINLRK